MSRPFHAVYEAVYVLDPTLNDCQSMELDEPITRSLHHQNQAILDHYGLNRLPKLINEDLASQSHPLVVLFDSHAVDSGFRTATKRVDKFEKRFRLSIAEYCKLYDVLKPFIDRPMFDENAIARPGARSLSSAEMLLVWLWRADDINAECCAVIFGDIDRTTIDRSTDHTTRAINDGLSDWLKWPDAEERQWAYGMLSSYHQAVGVLDGTHCSIDAPLYEEYEHFSG